MKIKEIYKKFKISPNLQDHMLTVASTVIFLKDNWQGEKIDWNKIVKAALLHDLGNIVKFDMDKFPDLMREEVKRIDYWKKVQRETIAKYGSEDHKVTEKMLRELNVKEDVIKTILEKSFGNSEMTVFRKDWNTKILLYCDVKTSPTGLVTLDERIVDIKRRMPKYTNKPNFSKIVKAIKELEKQIQTNLKIPISRISDKSVEKYKNDLLKKEI